jgi:hypothetical protein
MRVHAHLAARGVRIALGALLLARLAASEAEPPAPAPATDSERQVFCKEATAHRLPGPIADAAALALGHGFHFDSFQCVPAAAEASADPADKPAAPVTTATPVAKTYRIQVMDDQNQALEIQVGASNTSEPLVAATSEWMCWSHATAATARNDVRSDDRPSTP